MNKKIHIFLSVISLLLFSGCVSKKNWNALVQRANSLETKLSNNLSEYGTDQDGDGVLDIFDEDTNTPANCPVNVRGITLDSDRDNIIDCEDQEIFSPPGVNVDPNGIADIPLRTRFTAQEVIEIVGAVDIYASSGEKPINYLDSGFYVLKLPLPKASTRHNYALQPAESMRTLGDVDQMIRTSLEEAGFSIAPSYFIVHDPEQKKKGFAILTPIEIIDKNAVRQKFLEPGDDEFAINSLWDAWETLRNTRIGYSRFMVLLVTSAKVSERPVEKIEEERVREGLYNTYQAGQVDLRALGIDTDAIDPSTNLKILIYEFRRAISDLDRKVKLWPVASKVKHLKGARLDVFLD